MNNKPKIILCISVQWKSFVHKMNILRNRRKLSQKDQLKRKHITCQSGDIFMADLGKATEGSLQSGIRPVLIVSNNKANQYSPIITVVPFTSRLSKHHLPTHVYMKKCGLKRPSIAMAEQVTSINKEKLLNQLGTIKNTIYEERIQIALKIQLCMEEL